MTYALFLLFSPNEQGNPTKGVVVKASNNNVPAISFTAEGGTWRSLEVVFPHDQNVQAQQALREMSLGERVREARQRALRANRDILAGNDLVGRRVRQGLAELAVSRIYPHD